MMLLLPVLIGLVAVSARMGWGAEVEHLQHELEDAIIAQIHATATVAQAAAGRDADALARAQGALAAANARITHLRRELHLLGAPMSGPV